MPYRPYRPWESNPHTRRHQVLSLACLPFHQGGVEEGEGVEPSGFAPGSVFKTDCHPRSATFRV